MTYVLKGSEPLHAPTAGRLEGSTFHGVLTVGEVPEEEWRSSHAGAICVEDGPYTLHVWVKDEGLCFNCSFSCPSSRFKVYAVRFCRWGYVRARRCHPVELPLLPLLLLLLSSPSSLVL